MASIRTYSYTQEELNDHDMRLLRIAKEMIIEKLIKEGIAEKDALREFEAAYSFILYKPKWYKKYSKVFNIKKEDQESHHIRLQRIFSDDEVLKMLTGDTEEDTGDE